jgi:hypothetical protein
MGTEKLALKKSSLAQKMNKLKEQEAKIKELERKSRNRKIFELGGLVEKAQLDSLNTNQLYGAFLEIADKSRNAEALKKWELNGGSAFNSDAKEKGEAVVVTFPEKPSLEIRKQIREFGLKWNSFREEWQGLCKIDDIADFVKVHRGNLLLVKEPKYDIIANRF